MADGIPARLTAVEGRRFAFTVGAAFGVLGAIMWWREHPTGAYITGGLAMVLFIAGLLVPSHLGPVNRAWMGMAHVLSRITTPVFMGVVYFLVIAPVGMLMRAFGRNPIRHRSVNGSYWASRGDARGDLTNQF